MRNQSIAGSALPDLSEAAEQEKGDSLFFLPLVYIRRRFLSAFSRVGTSWISGKRAVPVKKDDDLLLCFCSSMPPVSWQYYNKELIHFPSADGSIVEAEPTKEEL